MRGSTYLLSILLTTSTFPSLILSGFANGGYPLYLTPNDIDPFTGYLAGAFGTQSPGQYCKNYDLKPDCPIPPNLTIYDYNQRVSSFLTQKKCRKCEQSTDQRCLASNLKQYFRGQNVKAAYCTDVSLVILANQVPSWNSNQHPVPQPNGDFFNGQPCNYRTYPNNTPLQDWRFPLSFYDSGKDESVMGKYQSNPFSSYYGNLTGYPNVGGTIGSLVDGTQMNPGVLDPVGSTNCNLAACGDHIANFPWNQCPSGIEPPHSHGDPFGPNCLYYNTTADYPNDFSHPPLIGFIMDGAMSYGRYFKNTQLGFNVSLDNCGGHSHDDLGYHYHAQVFNMTAQVSSKTKPYSYPSWTNGPLYCLRGDVTKINDPYSLNQTLSYPCCGMKEYYIASSVGITSAQLNGLGYPVSFSQQVKESRSQSKAHNLGDLSGKA